MNPKNKNKKPNKNKKQNDKKNIFLYILISVLLFSTLASYLHEPKQAKNIEFSAFMQELDNGSFSDVTVSPTEHTLVGKTKNGNLVKTFFINYPELIPELQEKGINISVNPNDSGWVWSMALQAFLPFILIALLWFFIFRQAQGANNQAMSFGKNRAKVWNKADSKNVTTFKDVAGAEEAVEELKEIVDFLKTPKKFVDIGAKIPKGALLIGPPGTGKTLLAKAVAGEADVPFYSISGSDFVEMFVGVGASRVRDLFAQAKKTQPCLIFLDEIDAVGRHRGAGLGGGHDEREQTLNQLLVEMDGFNSNETIIVIAATNRADILDPALLRPGRFDRQITVDKPSVKGRLDILKIHAKGKKISKDVDLEIIAKRTPGFTGADLANLTNESALLAARHNKKIIDMKDIEAATDRIIAGPERKSQILTNKEKEIVAYHEMGHAIVAAVVPKTDPVHKISILPRGNALGYTMQLPVEDKHLMSKEEIESQIKILMGGRIAEELIFGDITSGASNDIERATNLARNFICQFGMSKKLGTRKFGSGNQEVFIGKSYNDHSKDYSEATAREIDEEMKTIIDTCYEDAKKILIKNKQHLIDISKILLEKEVIERVEFETLFGHKPANSQTTT